jgi:peptidoglycan/LPS O-acetylase OafA/YrhL
MKINYRPEIDGLRAIAVLFVVLYHAKFIFLDNLYFNGGYIGVDIFFVISGYLIASIIFKEQLLKKSFSFSNFYKRRVRRILPVLVFISLITIPFGLIFIIPNDFVKFSNSLFFLIIIWL